MPLDNLSTLHYPRGVRLTIARARRALALLATLVQAACGASFMELHPMQFAPASPSSTWTPPVNDSRDSRAAIGADLAPGRHVPEDIHAAPDGLTLPQLLDIGLRNSPATRQTWAAAPPPK